MARLRDVQNAALQPAQPILPDGAPLARFRGNALYRMPNIQTTATLGHRVNDLRGMLFHGSRRGATWRIYQIEHAIAHNSDLEAARPQFLALQNAVAHLLGEQPFLLAVSGAPGCCQAYMLMNMRGWCSQQHNNFSGGS